MVSPVDVHLLLSCVRRTSSGVGGTCHFVNQQNDGGDCMDFLSARDVMLWGARIGQRRAK